MTKKAKLWAFLTGVAAVLALGLGGAVWHFATLILYPGVTCWPHYVKCGDPAAWGLPFENVRIPTSAGLSLPGWYMPAEGSRKAVIFVHGHGGSLHEGMKYAPVLHRAGYNLLAFSLRRNLGNLGEGEAGLYYATMGCLEKEDILAAVDFLAQQKGMQAIGVFGFSMGAAGSVLAMEEDHRIAAGIFNSPYANIEDQLAEVGQRKYHLPRYPLLPLVVWVAGLRGGVDMDQCNPVDHVGAIAPRPIFIMHCTGDDYVAFPHARRMFAAARAPKAFWAAPCNRHVQEWNQCRAEAEQRVVAFFNRTLTTRP